MRARRVGAAVLTVTLGLTLAGCGDDGTPAEPAAVALMGKAKVKEVRIGLLYSDSSALGEGQEWAAAATGAEIAARRFGGGRTTVTIVPANDDGDANAATSRVKELVEQQVAGIVVATAGSHVDAAVEAATDAGVPVLLPYYGDADSLPEGAWATGVTDAELAVALPAALDAAKASDPLVVTSSGSSAGGVAGVDRIDLDAVGSKRTVERVRKALANRSVDSVLIAAPAAVQAALVPDLQGLDEDLPIVLTPEVLSPAFGTEILAHRGTLAGSLVTVGPSASDVSSSGSGPDADRAAAFFAALRLAASDPDGTSEITGQPWSQTAGASDIASHDAVIALVGAALAAGSTDPGAVMKALPDLALKDMPGLAGPLLDFSDGAQALPEDAVDVLFSTTQDPLVRPVAPVVKGAPSSVPAHRLFWFTLDGDDQE